MTDADKNSAPDRNEFWNERVGPFYGQSGALDTTELSSTEFEEKVAADEILEVSTSDHVRLYPTFQFGPHGELLPGLQTVTAILRPFSDDTWDVAIWLATPTGRFAEGSAADALKAGDIDSVLSFARHDTAMWST